MLPRMLEFVGGPWDGACVQNFFRGDLPKFLWIKKAVEMDGFEPDATTTVMTKAWQLVIEEAPVSWGPYILSAQRGRTFYLAGVVIPTGGSRAV